MNEQNLVTAAEVKSIIEKRIDRIGQILQQAKHEIGKCPEGKMHVVKNHGTLQYYHRVKEGDPSGTYIRKGDTKLISSLVRKKYWEKVEKVAAHELRELKRFPEKYDPDTYLSIYESFPEEQKRMLNPLEIPDSDYVERWLAIPYTPNPFPIVNSDYFTDLEEQVRSKSELNIANALNKYHVPYKYEYPVKLRRTSSGHMETVYPDFCTLNVRTHRMIYWEHLGMMDDKNYMENALVKIADYQANGIIPGDQLIITYETMKNQLSTRQIRLLIEHYLL